MSELLTVDLGNTRCKLRVWSTERGRSPVIVASHDLATGAGLAACAAAWLRGERRSVRRAAISSVADPALEDELARALSPLVDLVLLRPAHGLAIACREPELVGADRLWAARGAYELVGAPVLVVDAGTAITVDALGPGDPPVFQGGAIAPGPELGARALAEHTARLPRIVPRAGVRALGRDTEEALQAGIVVGARGALLELVRRIGEESGAAGAPLVVTGGACRLLVGDAGEVPFGARRVVVEPELVALGLVHAIADPVERARS